MDNGQWTIDCSIPYYTIPFQSREEGWCHGHVMRDLKQEKEKEKEELSYFLFTSLRFSIESWKDFDPCPV
jgi:hypothetical protein